MCIDMKYLAASIICCVVSALWAQGQFEADTVHLPASGKLHAVNRFPFDRLEVFDNRFDTTGFRICQPGSGVAKVDVFDNTASEAIKVFIETAISPIPRQHQVLYISIRQLRFGNIETFRNRLFFAADAYYRYNDAYRKITSVNRIYVDKRVKGTGAFVAGVLTDLIEEIGKDYYEQEGHGFDKFSAGDMNVPVTDTWASYPIITRTSATDGIYRSFDDLRNNRIIRSDFILQMAADSTYRISFNEPNEFYDKKKNSFHNIWAVSYHGVLYLPLMAQYFLPLERRNNRLYFYVPHSLPDMHTIIFHVSPAGLSSSGAYDNLSRYSNNSSVAVLGAALGLMVDIIRNSRNTMNEKNKTVNNEDMRNCFLDMDTGDIIYR